MTEPVVVLIHDDPELMLIHMTMTRRIQIPIDETELALVKAAAKRAGVSVAEWA